jgi:hypothetical protein
MFFPMSVYRDFDLGGSGDLSLIRARALIPFRCEAAYPWVHSSRRGSDLWVGGFMTILNDEMMGWNRSFKLGSYSQEAIYSHQRDRSADEKM